MQTAALSDAAFDTLLAHLSRLHLAADCTCNLFPPSLRLTGPTFDRDAVAAYLAHAFARLHRLGTRKVVFGSTARATCPPAPIPKPATCRLALLTGELIVPLLERYDMLLAVEPIRHGEANFICTLADGMELVRRVNHPRVRLLADTIHMLCEHESPESSPASPPRSSTSTSVRRPRPPAHRYSPPSTACSTVSAPSATTAPSALKPAPPPPPIWPPPSTCSSARYRHSPLFSLLCLSQERKRTKKKVANGHIDYAFSGKAPSVTLVSRLFLLLLFFF